MDGKGKEGKVKGVCVAVNGRNKRERSGGVVVGEKDEKARAHFKTSFYGVWLLLLLSSLYP